MLTKTCDKMKYTKKILFLSLALSSLLMANEQQEIFQESQPKIPSSTPEKSRLNDENSKKMKNSVDSICFLENRQEIELSTLMDKLASVAAQNPEVKIDGIFPATDTENLNIIDLIQKRDRFNLLVNNALSFLSKSNTEKVRKYIEELEEKFQNYQEEPFDILVCEPLKLVSIEDAYLLSPDLFNITGGFEGILATTPDKAFVSSLRDCILEDFKTVIHFIKSIEPIAEVEQRLRIKEAKEKLNKFYIRWNEENVATSLINEGEKSMEIPQEFMRIIKNMIEEIKQ